jgi:hypothetical protein
MVEGHPAHVFLNQRKGRAGDLFRVNAKAFGNTFGEVSLSST